MDAKIIVYGFCLFAIIAGTGFWRYTMGIDEAEKDMLLARSQVNTVEDSVKSTKGWLEARKEAAALMAAAKVIEGDNEQIKTEIKQLQEKRKDVSKVFVSSIERARNEMNGKVLAEITLTTGVKLRNAKIQSLDQEITVFQHSEGVSKVPTASLPADFQDRLRYGFTPGGGEPSSSSTPRATGSSSSLSTSVSDRLARAGMNAPQTPEPSETPVVASQPAAAPATTPVTGQRESLGRVYTPGKGWERTGAGGNIAPPSLSSSTTGMPTKPSDAVSKVKKRSEMPNMNNVNTNTRTGF